MPSNMAPLALQVTVKEKDKMCIHNLGTASIPNVTGFYRLAGVLEHETTMYNGNTDMIGFPIPLPFGNLNFPPSQTPDFFPHSALKHPFDSRRPRRKKSLQFQETVNVRWVQARKDIEDDSRQGIWWSKEEVDDFKEKSRTVCKLFRKFEQPSRDFMRSSSVRNLCDKQNIDLHDLSTPRGFEARLCFDRSQKRKEALKGIVNHQRSPGADDRSLSEMSQQVSESARVEALQMGLRDEAEVRETRTSKSGSEFNFALKRKIELLSMDMTPSGWRNNLCVTSTLKNDFLDTNIEETPKANWQRQKVRHTNLNCKDKAEIVTEVNVTETKCG